MDGAHTPRPLPMGPPAAARSAAPNGWHPLEFAGLQPMRQRRGIDVSWTIANTTAGPGYFLTGDAASIVDPLSSHGILKAVMSGMNAAHHSAAVLRRGVSPEAAANSYHDWLARWFIEDHSRLGELYRVANTLA